MSLTRRQLLINSAMPLLAAAQNRVSGPPPNVLLILADDLASWMVGCYGNKEIRTPHIDRLAQGGVRFINNYVCTPICSASRATLFTGRVPRQTGVIDFLTDRPVENPPQGQLAPPVSFKSEVMLSDILAGQGYDCGYAGKWHMGDDQNPQHHFSYWYSMLGGSATYQNPKMSLNGKTVEEKGYLADLITRRSCEFLDRQKPNRPFFLVSSYFNPHTPYDGHPPQYYDMYAKTNFETFGFERPAPNALREKNFLKDIAGNIRKCAAATTALDDQIPALQQKLYERSLSSNTLIIFAGDNGFLLGRHGLWSKGLASDPINMYEEVMQVPMIWNWPGRLPVESARPELVSFYDVLPSVCEATGAPLPAGRNLCGRSYLPLAMNRPFPKRSPWRNLVFGHFRNTEMVRDSRFKLVLRNEGGGPNELYNLSADPREKTNQYENPQFSSVRTQLTGELAEWRRRYSS